MCTVTALDRANAEDAVHPLPKLYQKEKKRKHSMRHTIAAVENAMVDSAVNDQKKTWSSDAGACIFSSVPVLVVSMGVILFGS